MAPDSIHIPVFDISAYLRGDQKESELLVSSISAAAKSPGFFQITGHGLPTDLTCGMFQHLASFFALPMETKLTLHRSKSEALRGFEAVGDQRLEKAFIDSKEGFMIGPDKPAEGARFLQGPNQWPAETQLKGFKEYMMTYFQKMQELSKIMFRLIALGLQLDERYFDEFVGSENCTIHAGLFLGEKSF